MLPAKPLQEASQSVRSFALLDELCNDIDSNYDACFLDAYQRILEEYETSQYFKPHLAKMKGAYFEGRRAAKKRLIAVRSTDHAAKDCTDCDI